MHDHDHNLDHHHVHEHTHDHNHDHEHHHDHTDGHDHHHDEHGSLLKSKEEAAAFVQYTLHHNAHHDDELAGLIHSLQHLGLNKEADEVRMCAAELAQANNRLKAVLTALK